MRKMTKEFLGGLFHTIEEVIVIASINVVVSHGSGVIEEPEDTSGVLPLPVREAGFVSSIAELSLSLTLGVGQAPPGGLLALHRHRNAGGFRSKKPQQT